MLCTRNGICILELAWQMFSEILKASSEMKMPTCSLLEGGLIIYVLTTLVDIQFWKSSNQLCLKWFWIIASKVFKSGNVLELLGPSLNVNERNSLLTNGQSSTNRLVIIPLTVTAIVATCRNECVDGTAGDLGLTQFSFRSSPRLERFGAREDWDQPLGNYVCTHIYSHSVFH